MLLQDIRYAFRVLRATPLVSLAIGGTVALAIAANTAIFALVNAVLIKPLPFEEPQRLVQVAEKNDRLNLQSFGASALNFVAWREQARSFETLAAVGFATFTLGGDGEPEQLAGNRLSPALLPALGLAPVAGRGFLDAEEHPGAPAVAMLGERLWTRRFGRDPGIVGRTILLNGQSTTVVGIAPASLWTLSPSDIFVPLTIDAAREIRLNHVLFVIGRLKRGVTLRQAQAECDAIAAHLAGVYPEMRDWGINLITFFDTFVSKQLEAGLIVLLSAVALVLAIACANIANLLLARAAGRSREMAIRSALGATRASVVRQLLVESVLVAGLGGTAGIVLAVWAVRAVNAALPPTVLPVPEIGVDWTVLGFAAALTVASGLAFGVAPAWHAARSDVADTIKASGGGVGGRVRLRSWLAGAELALATMLLIGAGLLARTLLNLERVPLGFQPRGLLTFQLAPATTRYSIADGAPALYRRVLETLRALPGVRCAAISSGVPFGQGNYTTSPVGPVGPSALAPDATAPIDWRIVSPGYFATMTIPLVRGRDFTDADGGSGPSVTIVSQATAKRFWGDADPIGRAIRRAADGRQFTVVGVAGDVRSTVLSQESPAMYYPMAARVWPLMDVVVQSNAAPESLLPTVRAAIRQIDPELPLATVRTMDDWVASSAAQPRLSAVTLGIFAGAAVLIASIGIYAVLAYSVSQRTREIGLRIALGAGAAGVTRLIVREGMVVALAGIAAGIAGALVLGSAMSSLVYGVAPRDPATTVGVAGALGVIALAACVLPARRAARVDPMIALRHE